MILSYRLIFFLRLNWDSSVFFLLQVEMSAILLCSIEYYKAQDVM